MWSDVSQTLEIDLEFLIAEPEDIPEVIPMYLVHCSTFLYLHSVVYKGEEIPQIIIITLNVYHCAKYSQK